MIMADITLAEFNGCMWLVGGEPLIDDLLANTLAPGISIEVVPCEHKSEVHRLWHELCGKRVGFGEPWLIHPAIAERTRRKLGGETVVFAEWSAAIDQEGRGVIAGVAGRCASDAAIMIDVVEFRDEGGPKSAADLSRLRAQLVEEALVGAGVDAGRIGRVTKAAAEATGAVPAGRRIEITVRAPTPG
jgi:hypothetical protein